MSTLEETTENRSRYGPPLGEFFDPTYLDLSRRAPPSEDDLRQAIQSLSRPEDVSCETFKLILAMEWTPTCSHLGLLVSSADSESDTGVFPSCIKLLQQYCHVEGRGLFDELYGFLCLQVVSLSLEVAKLAQFDRLQHFLSELSRLPLNQSISESLNKHTREREKWAFLEPGVGGHASFIRWTFQTDTDTVSCLREIGGCYVSDMHFLVGQLWSVRMDILRTAKWAVDAFLGWRGLLYAIWNVMFGRAVADHNRRLGIMGRMDHKPRYGSGGNTPEQEHYWIQFLDIAYRYSLCSSEIDNEVFGKFLTHCPRSMESLYHPTGTTVNDLDSNAITTAYMAKFESIERLDNALAPRLFDYARLNLRPAKFEKNLSQIVATTFERAWVELSRAHELSIDQWGAFTICIIEILSMIIGMCESNAKHMRAVLTIAASKDLFEYLGRLLLFPLSSLGIGIIENTGKRDSSRPSYRMASESENTKEWDSKLHQNVLANFGSVLAKHMIEEGFKPSEDLLVTWYKTFQCFRLHKLLPRTKSGHGYAQTWERIWLHIGRSLQLYQQTLLPIRCAYIRCAAPDHVLTWECEGCGIKRYCSRRCQQGDWVHSTDSHGLRCKGEGGRRTGLGSQSVLEG